MKFDVVQNVHLHGAGTWKVKLASNDVGCIREHIWNEQCRIMTYIAINLTKCYCFKTCMKLVTTIKDFLNFVMTLNWAAIIGYRLARGRPFYSNDVLLLHQVTIPLHQGKVPLFGLHHTQSNDMTQNCISSETHKWYMCQSWEIESQHLWFKQMVSLGGVGGQNTLFILAPMCFLWNKLWSVCRYAIGTFRGSSAHGGCRGGKGKPPPFKNCMSGIGDYRFTFLFLIDLTS